MYSLVSDSLKPKIRGLWGIAYTNGRDFVKVQQADFKLFVNPVLHTNAGLDRNNFPSSSNDLLPVYTNTRGVEIRGSAWDKLGFYTQVADNISRFPQFAYDRYTANKTLDGEGFIKTFGNENGLDYFSTRAYITYSPISQVRIKFGKDRAFWGHGYQSLLLSDYAADYLLLNIQTRIWKLVYTNHFTQMIDFLKNKNDTEGTFPRKYGVFHMLSWQPDHRFSIGLFEALIYNPWLANGRRGFEIQYLNPIIFYRAIEQYLNSSDNAMLGLQWKANFLKHAQFYGQLLLDDYNFGIRDQGSGYRGNKLGYQLGAKYIDAFTVPSLDLQLEYNRLRPFTYQHFNNASNYAHYDQYLGHAAGGNLFDYHFIVRYRPFPAWQIYGVYSRQLKGLDKDGINYGGDVNEAFINWPADFGNTVAQGSRLEVSQLYGRLTYQFGGSDIYLEIEGRYRQERYVETGSLLKSLSVVGGLRVNMVGRQIKY